jgi:hypothetical protein
VTERGPAPRHEGAGLFQRVDRRVRQNDDIGFLAALEPRLQRANRVERNIDLMSALAHEIGHEPFERALHGARAQDFYFRRRGHQAPGIVALRKNNCCPPIFFSSLSRGKPRRKPTSADGGVRCVEQARVVTRLPRAILPLRRRDGRVAEGARLESVYTGNRIVGSNPTPSATSAFTDSPSDRCNLLTM